MILPNYATKQELRPCLLYTPVLMMSASNHILKDIMTFENHADVPHTDS